MPISPSAGRIAGEYSGRRVARLPPRDRPREKLGHAGHHALGDHELVALVLGHGVRGRDGLALATQLLEAAGGVHGLARATVEQLAGERGVGPVTAARLVAAVELGRRTLLNQPPGRIVFQSPRQVAAFLMPLYGSAAVERFGVVLVDRKHQLIRAKVLASGSVDAVTAEPRDVFRQALLGGASGVIVFHNHPSGDPTPSQDDISLTRRLAAAGKVVGIDLVDHLVIADSRYVSMQENGHTMGGW